MGEGGFELAVIFAELGWNPVHAEGGVDFFFGGSGDEGSVFDFGEGVFAERVAALEGALAGGDVVHLGAGEVLQGCSVAGLGEEADVDLEAGAEAEADLVGAFGDEGVDGRIGGHVFDGGSDFVFIAAGAGGEEVEVADGVAATAERSGGGDGGDSGEFEEVGGDVFGGGFGVVEAEAAGVFAVFGDAFF